MNVLTLVSIIVVLMPTAMTTLVVMSVHAQKATLVMVFHVKVCIRIIISITVET